MSQEAIDEWLADSVFWFTFLGWPPVGISIHKHITISFLTGKEICMYETQYHELQPTQ